MPTYCYACDKCNTEKEIEHSIKEDPEIKCECGNIMNRKVVFNTTGFILKGSGWAGKDAKEKNYRLKRRKEVGKKMVKSYDIPQILPNYKGEVCSSWEKAKDLAKKDGVDTTHYDAKAQALQKTQHETKKKVEKISKGEE